jgi:putative flippase GtrA
MKATVKMLINKELVRFGLVGLVNTGIDWVAYLFLTRFFDWWSEHYIYAKIGAFTLAVTNSYFLNRYWTFNSNDRMSGQITRFIFTSLVGLYLSANLLALSVERLKVPDIWGLLLATLIVFSWNFLINKFWVFKDSSRIREKDFISR